MPLTSADGMFQNAENTGVNARELLTGTQVRVKITAVLCKNFREHITYLLAHHRQINRSRCSVRE